MTLQPIVALDLGATKVACAIGLPHERSPGFELLGSGLASYPVISDSWMSDPLMVGQTIERAVEAAGGPGDASRALVTMSHPALSSERVRAVIALGDEPVTVRARDLDRLQAAALSQALAIDREPLLIERLSSSGNGFDGVRDPRGLSATRLAGTFHILTMPAAARRAVAQAVESAGFEVARLTCALSAVWAGLADEALARRRALLIDAGGLTVDIGLFVEGVLFGSAVVRSGGITLAAAIAKELHVTMDQAAAWSLEGAACRKPGVRPVMEAHWQAIREAAGSLLVDQPRPDLALVSGRGGLVDGFVEWLEHAIGMPTSLGRSPRASRFGDLSRQLGLSPSLGLLELATRAPGAPLLSPSPRLFNRLMDRTRLILTEYF